MNTKLLKLAALALSLGLFGLSAVQAQDAPLRAGDSVDLRIGGIPADDASSVTGQYVIDNQGMINLSYIGKISVAGKTAAAAADAIELAYRTAEIYSHPTITLNTQSAARFVNVGGEVKSPGRFPFTPDMTVMRAITAAGGFTEFANRAKVRLLRGKEVMGIDARKIMKDPSLDVSVLPGDQIFVEQSFF